MAGLRTLLQTSLRALLPSRCALCGGGCDDSVCGACREAYAGRQVMRCACCANPLPAPHDDASSLRTAASFPSTTASLARTTASLPRTTALLPRTTPSFPRRRESRFSCAANDAGLDPRLRGDDSSVRGDDSSVRGDDSSVRGDDGSVRGDDHLRCGACLAAPPAFDATVAAVDYAAPLDQLVLHLKFGACLPLAPWCARLVRDAVLARPGLPLPDLLCPVPLGPGRLAERGFNQALEIARPLAAALGVALHPRLAVRTLETPAQSGVAPAERAGNVRGAFALEDPDVLAGRHVGLVDDVMTSGHTLAELAAVCKAAGAARVTNFVFARTPPHA